MTPEERENQRYANGAINPIGYDEELLFSFIPQSPSKILDVGCGIGTIAKNLMGIGHMVDGIDFSSVAVEMAQNNGVNASVVDVDKEGLPFPESSYDVVYAGDIVEHVFDPIGLIENCVKVLKPGGRFIFSVPNDITLKRRFKIGIFGVSPQSEVYRNYRQSKHHTVMSRELLDYFLSKVNVSQSQIVGSFQNPWTKNKRKIKSSTLSSLFAQSFIVCVEKSELVE